MTTGRATLKCVLGAAAVSLSASSGLSTADNPFGMQAIGPPERMLDAELKIAMGMCGMSCGGNMKGMDQRKKKESGRQQEGTCGSQMERMSGSNRASATGGQMEGTAEGDQEGAGGMMEGNCGGMMKGVHASMREGMCGGMMEGMCGGNMPHGISPDALPDPNSPGAKALTRYCTQCHGLPGPGMQTAQEWPAIVGRMNTRMQMMAGMMGMKAPDQSELNAVLEYLQEHAQRPIDKAAYADLNTPAGGVFNEFCSQCHALPDPKQHAAREWPGVVTRMKGHMAIRNKATPDQDQTKQILGFLKRHVQ